MQRLFDIIFSGVALLIVAPLLVPIMILLRFTGEGEVFYVQQRVGANGRMFGLLKFATMLKNSPNIGTVTVTVKNDPRVLPMGGFLRKTKINELPQLINILVGDMSIVGPRPQDNVASMFFRRMSSLRLSKSSLGFLELGQFFSEMKRISFTRWLTRPSSTMK